MHKPSYGRLILIVCCASMKFSGWFLLMSVGVLQWQASVFGCYIWSVVIAYFRRINCHYFGRKATFYVVYCALRLRKPFLLFLSLHLLSLHVTPLATLVFPLLCLACSAFIWLKAIKTSSLMNPFHYFTFPLRCIEEYAILNSILSLGTSPLYLCSNMHHGRGVLLDQVMCMK